MVLLLLPFIGTISPFKCLCFCLRIFRDTKANGAPAGQRKSKANIFIPTEWRHGGMVKGLRCSHTHTSTKTQIENTERVPNRIFSGSLNCKRISSLFICTRLCRYLLFIFRLLFFFLVCVFCLLSVCLIFFYWVAAINYLPFSGDKFI